MSGPMKFNRAAGLFRDEGGVPTPAGGSEAIFALEFGTPIDTAEAGAAPVVDLNGAGAGTSTSLSYTENQPLKAIAPAATVADVDSPDLDTGTLTVEISANGTDTDRLAIIDQGTAVGQITVFDPDIYYNFGHVDGDGNPVGPELIGSFSGGTDGSSPLVVTLTALATPQVVQSLVRAIGFYNLSEAPSTLARTVTFTLSDGDGQTGDPAVATIDVIAVAETPIAENDSVVTNEDAPLINGNLFADNGSGTDFSPDETGFIIIAVNGSALNVGVQIITAKGGLLTVREDGTFDYDPNDKFNTLVDVDSGAANYSASDSFTYTITGGDSAAVTVNIAGVQSPEDIYQGDADDNVITGTSGNDSFRLQQGGVDEVLGESGNDFFYFGAALTGTDKVDGGAGNDQIAIQGNYTLTFGGLMVNIESLIPLPGNDVRFGDSGTNFYDYSLTAVDANLTAGQRLAVDANRLRVGEDFTFNGSAETDGNFFLIGGNGVDTLLGGSQSDTFLFGENGQFGASDVVNGGSGGANDQLGLRGDYVITFGAGQLIGIESIALVSSQDTRFGPRGSVFNYNLTMNDGNVSAGQMMTVDAAPLRGGETLTFNGVAELDGAFRVAGGAGNDTITGGSGGDILIGRGGADTMTGGAGNDQFRYNEAADSTSSVRDTILDFTTGDVIDLARIDAITGTPTNDAFTFIGVEVFSNVAGQLRATNSDSTWTVQGDVNGDGTADFELVVTVADLDPLTGTDFIL